MPTYTNYENEQAAVELSRRCQADLLELINANGWNHHPYIALHALLELSGALAQVMLQHEGAPVETVLGMVSAVQTRVERNAALLMPLESELRH